MLRALTIGGLVSLAAASAASAVTVPESDTTYIQFGDLTTFNYRILDAKGVIADVPATPTGNTTTAIRMFSNGNLSNGAPASNPLDAIKWETPQGQDPEAGNFNPTQTSSLWYGLQFDQGAVADVQTADDVLSFIKSSDGVGADTPLFAFDQTQQASDPDIFLRARLILVDDLNGALPGTGLEGLTEAQVNAAVAAAILANQAEVFTFFDHTNQFNNDGYVLLPGEYTAETFTVDNNIGGALADWGGFLAGLDLNDYLGRSFLVELQARGDNGGPEEAYIIGGLDLVDDREEPGAVPEPVTAGLGAMALSALAWAASRRPTR
jgi:hypothetical protein